MGGAPTGKEKELGSFPQKWMSEGPARAVYDALDKAGGSPRFVGGCVRDGLLGRKIKDVDIATVLTPDAIIAASNKAGLKPVPTGIEHGTVTVVADHVGIEVTTLRRDVETFGRHATVAFTDDWKADASRRDLTMNALFADMSGAIYDYFDGVRDLQAGRVRFVGKPEDRMTEDYLRILRFFRFHADYASGDFDAPAMAAAAALKGHLRSLSGERLRQETLKLMTARRAVETWRALLLAGIAGAYLPQATGMNRMTKLVELERTLRLAPDPIRRLAALSITGTGVEVAAILKLSNAERDRLTAMTLSRPIFATGDATSVRRQVYDLGNALALDLLLVDWAAGLPRATMERDWQAAYEIVRDWPRPSFPLTGGDAKALGVEPGPAIGGLMRDVEAWWIMGDFVADRGHCLDELRRRIAKGGT